ncbi:putative DNA-binding transcriptional regulator YafY [Paenibacillus amylolyticus]|uniref:DNA-binding transcriptional regulator YafY n=1 Tax=Paenibacillus amylolyticus TaxID=1451 RepID=A0AAP5GY60_PAEAM|nr:YafY family protein [Paenibacillus amylolyticus]MDR6722799.1 putative DNA-binding transcriptional regulator YafY [Paenibacillus amylolyticus]
MNNRKLAIMRLMDSRRKFTARELAERFQVSIRTIQRDLDALQSMGFPLYTEVGVHGGYQVLPNRLLPPLQLNQNEALGLFLMLEYLEKVPDFPYGSVREHLAEQYFSSLPQDVQDLVMRMRKHITFLQPHPSMHAQPMTTTMLDAAVEKRGVTFQYSSRNGQKTVRVFPIGIYYDRGYWYMPARHKERVLLYRVDRMSDLEITDETDESIPNLHDWLRAEDERERVEVVLLFTDAGVRQATSDVVFKSVEGKEWKGAIPVDELPYTARGLLAYGPEVKVLAPVELKQMVRSMLEKSLEQYL